MPTYPNEVTGELMARFFYAQSHRQQYEAQAIDNYKLYIGYRPKLDPSDPNYGRSNLHIPRSAEIADAWRARVFESFAGPNRPYFDFSPMPIGYSVDREAIAANERKAPKAAALVDMQLEKNNWVRLLYEHLTNLIIYPVAWMAVSWRYQVGKTRKRVRVPMIQQVMDPMTGEIVQVPVVDPMTGQPVLQWAEQDIETVLFDDNEITCPSFFDMWWDPKGRDVDTCRFIFQRERKSTQQLKDMLELIRKAGVGGKFYDPDWDALATANGQIDDDGQDIHLAEVGISTDHGGDSWPQEQAHKGYLHEVLHYWEDDRHAIIVDRNQCLYDGPNPYWRHRRKPFVAQSYEPLPAQFAGLAVMDYLAHLQHELNTNRNQRIDNVSLVLNRMWFRYSGADIPDDQLVSRPGGVVDVPAPGMLEPIVTPDVTASAYNEESIIKSDMESAIGTPNIVRGVDNDTKQTAREAMLKQSGAATRFNVKIKLAEHLGFKRLVMLMDMNNQQFITGSRLVRVGGMAVDDWQEVTMEDLDGEWDYRPAGLATDPSVNREVMREQFKDLLITAKTLQLPYAKMYELWVGLLGTYDLRNPQKYTYTEEEVMERMQATAQAEADAAMAQEQQAKAQQEQARADQVQARQEQRADAERKLQAQRADKAEDRQAKMEQIEAQQRHQAAMAAANAAASAGGGML
jgi:hypothetical protein